ncbi:MAG: acetylglutamate kinase [Dehalococcoidia bacterium]
MAEKPIVAKIGAGVLGEGDTLFADLVSSQRDGVRIVLVHGGGSLISQWQEVHGIEARFVRGLRVTDGSALEVATAVLAGLVNKVLVASLQAEGAKAVGLSGVDGGILQAEVLDSELGFVGRVIAVDPGPLNTLMNEGYLPVVAPIAFQQGGGEVALGGILNVNADTAAAELAAALGARRLIYLTDVPGVQNGSGESVAHLSREDAQDLVKSGVVSGGMIPKVEGCLRAAEDSVETCILDGRRRHALLEAVQGRSSGTRIG